MFTKNINRVVIDIQVPQGFTMSKESRESLTKQVTDFTTAVGEKYAQKGNGGIVASNHDMLKNEHSLIIVVGDRGIPTSVPGK